MPSFYFEQLLRTGLNGIDQQGITAAVLQIAGVILILSLLWAVYEAYSNGGDVRLLGVAAVKYLGSRIGVPELPKRFSCREHDVQWRGRWYLQPLRRDGCDPGMGKQHVPSMEHEPKLVFGSLELGYRRCVSHRCAVDIVGRLSAPSVHLHAFHALLRTVWVDLVCSRPVCAGADAFARLGPTGKIVLREHDGLPVLGPAVRNPAITDVGTADHRSDAVSRGPS